MRFELEDSILDAIVKSLMTDFAKDQGLLAQEESVQFEAFVAHAILSGYFEEEFNPLDFVIGAGGDLGVDIAGILINGDLLLDAADVKLALDQTKRADIKIILIQAKTSQSFSAAVYTDLADNLRHLFREKEVQYPANEDVINLKEAIDAIYGDLGKLNDKMPELIIRYATTGQVGDKLLSQKANSASRVLDDTNFFSRVDVQSAGARQLRDLYQAATTAVSADFSMDRRMTLPRMPGVTQAFIGLLPAKEIVRIITDVSGGIRKSVFFDNVRDFQDYNPVNAEIRETLRDASAKSRFAVLNNGVTIVSRSLTLAGDEFQLRDFQIVNGCQTCHVLFHEQDHLTDDIHLSVRVIQSQDEDVISGITAATNRQTAVTDDDLAAREQFQKDIEALFDTFPAETRLYYERRSKQYADLDVERTRIVTRAQLVRTFASTFLAEPARAGRYLRELRDVRADDLFNPTQSPLAYYASASLYYRIEWLIRNRRIDRKYRPARYQLLMAVKIWILGAQDLPQGRRKADPMLEKLIQVAWSPEDSETLVKQITPLVDAATEQETPGVPLNRDTVRTRSFSDRLKTEVLRSRPSGP